MRILSALRKSFAGIEAWTPGYQPMLDALRRGEGHLPVAAGKENQLVLDVTGCAYADSELLPALIASGKFVDQEGY